MKGGLFFELYVEVLNKAPPAASGSKFFSSQSFSDERFKLLFIK
jgi:hypothetical protein